jgi:hypothetical protein
LRLFGYRTWWGSILGAFCQNWTSWIFMGWLPLFLETQFHLSVARTGILATLPFMGGVALAMCGGFVSDFAGRRGVSTVNSRKIPIVAGTLGLAVFTGATGFANILPMALTPSFFALFENTTKSKQFCLEFLVFPLLFFDRSSPLGCNPGRLQSRRSRSQVG